MTADQARFRELETGLLCEEVRRDSARVDSLLTDDFLELGSSGRAFTKPEIVELLAETPRRVDIEAFRATAVADGVVLVTYRAVRIEAGTPTGEFLRSSLWVFRQGSWRMRFHQGTRVPDRAA